MTLTANAARTWNPDRMDPTRTGALRRQMLADLRRRFKEVKRRIVEHVRDNDAFGLTGNTWSDAARAAALESRRAKSLVEEYEEAPEGAGHKEKGGAYDRWRKGMAERVSGIPLGPDWNKPEVEHTTWSTYVTWSKGDPDDPDKTVVYRLSNHPGYPKFNPTHVFHSQLKDSGHVDPEGVDAISRITKIVGNELLINADPRFHFMATPEQLKAFQKWVRKLMRDNGLGGGGGSGGDDDPNLDDWLRWYAEEGFKRGAGRSFDDVRVSQLRKERPDLFAPGKQEALRDFYDGTKEEFLRSAFGRPVGIEKIKVLAARTFTDLKGVTDALVPKLSRTLLDGLTAGTHSKQIAKDLADVMDWALPRAETIARTEISRAYVEGQLDALENMGVERLGVMVEWSTAGDSAVCPLCQPLEGAVLKIDEARGMFPRHPNCRCALLPANVGEDEQGQKRGQKKVQKAIDESADLGGPTWAGADKRIAKKRPQAIV